MAEINTIPAGPPPQGECARRPSWATRVKVALLGSLVVTGLLVGGEGFRVLVGSNVHTVIPGKVYRCANPTEELLRDLIERYGIKTVLNLRGTCPMTDWYLEEAKFTGLLDVNQEDLNLSSGRLPSVTEIRELVKVLEGAEYPLLVHCRRGADRTGLVAAIATLLQEGSTVAQGETQLSWHFGHIPLGRPANLGFFLEYYQDWLHQHRRPHSAGAFRDWVLNGYQGGCCCGVFEKVALPEPLPRAGQPFSIQVRVRNTSTYPWRFNPIPTAGVHLFYTLVDARGELVSLGRAGLFDAVIEPGHVVDLTLPVKAIPAPGQYRLFMDLIDEQMGAFYQLGSEPVEMRLDIP